MVAALLIAGCSLVGRRGPVIAGDRACAVVDSTFAASGLRVDRELQGHTSIDVNQYRVNGRFTLRLGATGNTVLEFTSTSPMGGRREDVLVSYWEDTLRVFDREQGRYFEGAEVDKTVSEGAGFDVDLAEVLRRVLLFSPDCARLGEIRAAEDGGDLGGRIDGDRFTVGFDGGRVARADWPAPFSGAGSGERLEVDYRWAGGRLVGMTILAPMRSWRIRLDVDD